jgi:nucleotide-binding universal stress UspA family protein
MMNFKQILCPVDFSDYGRYALIVASSLANESGGKLHLVHVHQPPMAVDAGFAGYIPEVADYEALRNQLNEIIPTDVDVPYEHHLLVGYPSTEITKYASRHEIDVIVMGTHGRSFLAHLLMGSVAEEVVRDSPCPVLTLKVPERKP